MGKFKESLLKRRPHDLEEVNERAYKYIRIEEVENMAEKGCGKRPIEDNHRHSPEPKRQSALDWIRAPDSAYSRADLPRRNAFSLLQGHPRKQREVKEGKIEYLTPPPHPARAPQP
ncbi:hypothetical protein LIER_40943 [Lithospermum erythrorhizon]|uniref:Uncharacterized protein n=1 Tax=Lithospermum erythrorhizon TaxID=34254 RepID=A0AAV3R528_LITER